MEHLKTNGKPHKSLKWNEQIDVFWYKLPQKELCGLQGGVIEEKV